MTEQLTTRLLALLLLLTCATGSHAEHALTLYGEAPKYPADFRHFDYVNPEAPKGGTLRLPGLNGFDSLNPFIPKGNAADHISLVYDSLTYHSPDEPFTEYGLLAERIERDPDNLFVRFHLRPEARFNDGTPLTARTLPTPSNCLPPRATRCTASIMPMSPTWWPSTHSVRLISSMNTTASCRSSLASCRCCPNTGGKTTISAKPRCSHRWAAVPTHRQGGRRARITYERVKDWWGKDLPVNRGQYNFDRVQIDYYQDMSVALRPSRPASLTSTWNIPPRTGPLAITRGH